MKKCIDEFKGFALKGNMFDLAVGVIIGGAFGKIVSSLVNDIIMPLFGAILGGINFAELSVAVGSSVIKYGMFIQSIIDFVIIATSIFAIIKLIATLKISKKDAKEETKKSEEVLVLEEILKTLKSSKNT